MATENVKPKARNPVSGFTLIEIVVVVFIISLMALLVFPNLPSSDAANLRSSARSLASTMRYLEERAITTKSVYRLHLDMASNTVTVRKVADGEETTADDSFLSKHLLAEGVTISDVETPRLGRTSEGEVIVSFGVSGIEEFITVHLKGAKGDHFTVAAFPQNGKVKVLEGYQEVSL